MLAFPILLLGLGLAAACSGADGCFGGLIQPGLPVVIMVIAIINWTYIARIVRGQVLSLREKEFVEAARSLGASNRRIIVREILPNLVAPLIVYSSLLIPANILLEAALSFLGVGVERAARPPGAAMISEATGLFPDAWWFMLFPGLALLITVLAFNLRRRRPAGRPRPAPPVSAHARIPARSHPQRKDMIHVQVPLEDLAARSPRIVAALRARGVRRRRRGRSDDDGGTPAQTEEGDGGNVTEQLFAGTATDNRENARRGQEGRQAHRPRPPATSTTWTPARRTTRTPSGS